MGKVLSVYLNQIWRRSCVVLLKNKNIKTYRRRTKRDIRLNMRSELKSNTKRQVIEATKQIFSKRNPAFRKNKLHWPKQHKQPFYVETFTKAQNLVVCQWFHNLLAFHNVQTKLLLLAFLQTGSLTMIEITLSS